MAACGGGSEKPAAATPARTTVTLTPGDLAVATTVELAEGVAISGSLEPVNTVQLKTQVAGRIRRVHADRGTAVRRGQLLVEIEAEGVRGQVAIMRAQVLSAEAYLALARQRLESARRLHAAGAISDIDLKASEAAFQAADAQVAAAKAMATTAGENESHRNIVSPIDGVVSERFVEVGEAVKDAVAVLTLVDTRTLELEAQVGVDEAMKVRVGAPVAFTLDAVSGQAFTGRVARIDPRADPATRQVGIASRLPNPGLRIVAGQFARGRVVTGAARRVVAIPATAVIDSAGTARVFVVAQDRLTRRDITLGARDDARGLVAVTSGLAEGERVLAASVAGAAEGLSVTIAGDTAAAPKRTPPAADSASARKPGGA
jgi:RND family efflux transporter MFP subunit